VGELGAYGRAGDNLSTRHARSTTHGDGRDGDGQDPVVAYKPYFDLAPAQSALKLRGEASFENVDTKWARRYNFLLARRRAIVVREHIRTSDEFAAKNFNFDDITPVEPVPSDSVIDAWVISSDWKNHGGDGARNWWKASVALPAGLSTADEEAQGTLNRPAAPAAADASPRRRPTGAAAAAARLVPFGQAQSARRPEPTDRRRAGSRDRHPDGKRAAARRLRPARRQPAAAGAHAHQRCADWPE
jgi:hypothetical protein